MSKAKARVEAPAANSCPVSREQFRRAAKPVAVRIGKQPYVAKVREFASRSLGWHLNGQTLIGVDGVDREATVDLYLTLNHSRELP
jgi:hypothetical protein